MTRRVLATASLRDATATASITYRHSPELSLHALASARYSGANQVLLGATQTVADDVQLSASVDVLAPRAVVCTLMWRGFVLSTVGPLDAFYIGITR